MPFTGSSTAISSSRMAFLSPILTLDFTKKRYIWIVSLYLNAFTKNNYYSWMVELNIYKLKKKIQSCNTALSMKSLKNLKKKKREKIAK